MKNAILFGATGFVGSNLLNELLNNADYEKVIIVVRKNPCIIHPKLKIIIGDFHSLQDIMKNMMVDEIFITLGTTKKNTPNQEEYYQIDHDYPVLAAKMAKENGAKSVFIVSAVGANANSGIFYIKTKGVTEKDIMALNFHHTHIFRPSMILGTRKENRPMEKSFIKFWSFINPILIGKFMNKFKGMDGKDIAKAMNNAAKNQLEKVKIYHWEEMNELLDFRS